MRPAGVGCLLTMAMCINHSAWFFFVGIFLNLSGLLPIKIIYWDLKGQHYVEGEAGMFPAVLIEACAE